MRLTLPAPFLRALANWASHDPLRPNIAQVRIRDRALLVTSGVRLALIPLPIECGATESADLGIPIATVTAALAAHAALTPRELIAIYVEELPRRRAVLAIGHGIELRSEVADPFGPPNVAIADLTTPDLSRPVPRFFLDASLLAGVGDVMAAIRAAWDPPTHACLLGVTPALAATRDPAKTGDVLHEPILFVSPPIFEDRRAVFTIMPMRRQVDDHVPA